MKRKKSFSFADFLFFVLIGAIGVAIIYFFGYREYRVNQDIYLDLVKRRKQEQIENQEWRIKTQKLGRHIRDEMEKNEQMDVEFNDTD